MTYKCDVCEKTCEEGWDDREALAEFKRAFPGYPFTEVSVICDDCHTAMMNYTRSRTKK